MIFFLNLPWGDNKKQGGAGITTFLICEHAPEWQRHRRRQEQWFLAQARPEVVAAVVVEAAVDSGMVCLESECNRW